MPQIVNPDAIQARGLPGWIPDLMAERVSRDMAVGVPHTWCPGVIFALGTALGDWTADSAGLGYRGGAIVFSAMLAIIAAAYYRTTISRTLLFWAAFILTRPLGAVVGDFLDKPINQGGLALSRYSASAALLVLSGWAWWRSYDAADQFTLTTHTRFVVL